MDLTCHQLLAAAAFAEDQYAGIVGSSSVDQAVDPFLGLRLANDLAASSKARR